jgi:eukaryotic-like serine/threonine-protein kinase
METLIGRTLGRYRLEASLGRGGMAEVFRAVDTQLGRTVAVKVIQPAFAAQEEFRERFLREARLVAALHHPNVLALFDFGDEDGLPYLVMPYVEGGTLSDRMAGRPLPQAAVARWVRHLGAALDAAHEAGVLHRDVKPGNVLLDRGERALLADFGIASAADSSTRLTATGMVVGTPGYMAPELVQGLAASPASDRYALAVLAYEMLSGSPPFTGESSLAILHQHATQPVPPISARDPGLPAALDGFFAAALAKDPAARPASGRQLAEGLAALLPGAEPPTPATATEVTAVSPPRPAPGRASGARAAGSPAPGSAASAAAARGAAAGLPPPATGRRSPSSAMTLLVSPTSPSRSRLARLGRTLAAVVLVALAALVVARVLRHPEATAPAAGPATDGAGSGASGGARPAAALSPPAQPGEPAAEAGGLAPVPEEIAADGGNAAGAEPPPAASAATPAPTPPGPGGAGSPPLTAVPSAPPPPTTAPPAAAPDPVRSAWRQALEQGEEAGGGPTPERRSGGLPRRRPGAAAGREPLRDRAARALESLHERGPLSAADFEAMHRRSAAALARKPEDRLARTQETFARGGLAYLRGDDTAARLALVEMGERHEVPPTALATAPLWAFGQRDPEAPFADWEVAIIYGDAREEGLAMVDRHLAAEPDDFRAGLGRAFLLRLHGRGEEALSGAGELYRRAAAAEAPEAPAIALFAAEELALAKRWGEALDWYRRAAAGGGQLAAVAGLQGGRVAAEELGDAPAARNLLDAACTAGSALACQRARLLAPAP